MTAGRCAWCRCSQKRQIVRSAADGRVDSGDRRNRLADGSSRSHGWWPLFGARGNSGGCLSNARTRGRARSAFGPRPRCFPACRGCVLVGRGGFRPHRTCRRRWGTPPRVFRRGIGFCGRNDQQLTAAGALHSLAGMLLAHFELPSTRITSNSNRHIQVPNRSGTLPHLPVAAIADQRGYSNGISTNYNKFRLVQARIRRHFETEWRVPGHLSGNLATAEGMLQPGWSSTFRLPLQPREQRSKQDTRAVALLAHGLKR